MNEAALTSAEAIVDAELARGDRRSKEYREGMIQAVRKKASGIPTQPPPYPLGTAQADAYFAGIERGYGIYDVT